MESLPPELQALVLKRLDFATLMKCRRVSRQWKGMIEQKAVLSEIFVHFPLPEVNTSSLLPYPKEVRGDHFVGEEYPKVWRFAEALYSLFESLDIHRVRRITITNYPLVERELTIDELLVIWTTPGFRPDIFDVVRFENAVINYIALLDVLRMEEASHYLYEYSRDVILPKPKFSIEIVNIYVDGMWSPVYDFGGLAKVGAKIACLCIAGNVDNREKAELFQEAYRASFQPLSAEDCAVLQSFCESFSFHDAKQQNLYETAFLYVEKPAEETEEAQMQRWQALDVAALEPISQALIWDFKHNIIRIDWADVVGAQNIA